MHENDDVNENNEIIRIDPLDISRLLQKHDLQVKSYGIFQS